MADDRTYDHFFPKEAADDRRFSIDAESYASDDELTYPYHTRPSWHPKQSHSTWRWFGQLLVLSIVATTSFWLGARTTKDLGSCIRQNSQYSPGLEAITSEYHTVRFDGRFGPTSPFKGPPSPEVDAAWSRISEMGVIRISEDEFPQLNASIHATKLPDALGGGYMGLPEFVHQIHCVNMLWKATYPKYYQKMHDDIESDPQEMHDHMDHCADILRQKLMCDADMGIITYNWRKNHYRPHPNFNVQHKCRDFDAALQWGRARQVDASILGGQDYFTRPDDLSVVDFDEPPFDPFAEK